MKLKWYGHASFRIVSDDANGSATTIITDPYRPDLAGYKPYTEAADIVVISSATDSYHDNADLIPGSPQVINALDLARGGGRMVSEQGIPFAAIEAMEALDHHQHDPDQNGMYRFTVDDINIGHMGDVGNPLNPEQLAFFAGVDILLALAGGHPTIGLDDLQTVIAAARPRLVVPMHFRTLRYRPRDMLWISAFLAYFPDEMVDFASEAEVTLQKSDLPEPTRVLVLDYW